jgi:anti-sigma28 factor (negative regulator of flagellin synthesis)
MVPTNPLDSKTPRKTAGPGSLRGARAPGPDRLGPAVEGGPAVQVESGLSTLARATTGRLDKERLEALREAVRSGSFEVDAKALASRIVDDALGPEAG